MWRITSQKYGANALGIQRVLGLGSYHTVRKWLHKFRRAMVRLDREKLSGVVEVDDTYVGGQKSGKRARGAEGKALVMIAVEDNFFLTHSFNQSILPNISGAADAVNRESC